MEVKSLETYDIVARYCVESTKEPHPEASMSTADIVSSYLYYYKGIETAVCGDQLIVGTLDARDMDTVLEQERENFSKAGVTIQKISMDIATAQRLPRVA